MEGDSGERERFIQVEVLLDSLPPEIQVQLLAFLTPKELAKICRTCKSLRTAGLSDG